MGDVGGLAGGIADVLSSASVLKLIYKHCRYQNVRDKHDRVEKVTQGKGLEFQLQ